MARRASRAGSRRGCAERFVNQGGTQLVQEVLDDLCNASTTGRSTARRCQQGAGERRSRVSTIRTRTTSARPTTSRSRTSRTPISAGSGSTCIPDPLGPADRRRVPGSPAARAGLGSGDLILAVGSTSLAGPHGRLRLAPDPRAGGDEGDADDPVGGIAQRSVSITRAEHRRPGRERRSIKSTSGMKLGYLQFTSFTDGSGDELRTQVKKVLNQGAQALILDLRENGGGLLNEAVNVASIFIPDGTIVSTAGRSQPRQVYAAKGNAIAAHDPAGRARRPRHRVRRRDRHRRAPGPPPRARRRHAHVRQGRLPGDPAAPERRRARHHGRRVLHAERAQPRRPGRGPGDRRRGRRDHARTCTRPTTRTRISTSADGRRATVASEIR